MEKIVIERLMDGQMFVTDIVEQDHRLMNERDLDALVGEGSDLAFVRLIQDTVSGYYKDKEGLWTYGEYETALNEIKGRL